MVAGFSPRSCLERQQIFHKVAFFLLGEAEFEELVVMIDDVSRRRKPAIMIEAALLVSPQTFQW